MGMGFASVRTTAISYNDLKEFCGNEIEAIENHESFEGWGELARSLTQGEEDVTNLFFPLVQQLVKKFEQATEVDGNHLTLFLSYYSEDDGDRYDEVEHTNNCIFELGNVYQLTAPAQKFKDILSSCSYVVFG